MVFKSVSDPLRSCVNKFFKIISDFLHFYTCKQGCARNGYNVCLENWKYIFQFSPDEILKKCISVNCIVFRNFDRKRKCKAGQETQWILNSEWPSKIFLKSGLFSLLAVHFCKPFITLFLWYIYDFRNGLLLVSKEKVSVQYY